MLKRRRADRNPYPPFWAGCPKSKYRRMPHHTEKLASRMVHGQGAFAACEIEPVLVENNWLRWKVWELAFELKGMETEVQSSRNAAALAEFRLQECQDQLRKAMNKAHQLGTDNAGLRSQLQFVECTKGIR